jgi:hypothetical protein
LGWDDAVNEKGPRERPPFSFSEAAASYFFLAAFFFAPLAAFFAM